MSFADAGAARARDPGIRRYPTRYYSRGASRTQKNPCWQCSAPDGRDAAHAAGCPQRAPLTQERLLQIALAVEAGWAKKHSTFQPMPR